LFHSVQNQKFLQQYILLFKRFLFFHMAAFQTTLASIPAGLAAEVIFIPPAINAPPSPDVQRVKRKWVEGAAAGASQMTVDTMVYEAQVTNPHIVAKAALEAAPAWFVPTMTVILAPLTIRICRAYNGTARAPADPLMVVDTVTGFPPAAVIPAGNVAVPFPATVLDFAKDEEIYLLHWLTLRFVN
jgi:hypothetical protein